MQALCSTLLLTNYDASLRNTKTYCDLSTIYKSHLSDWNHLTNRIETGFS